MKGRYIHKVKALLGNRAIILMYHRVASPDCDPWQLAVSSQNFEQQLNVLKKTGHVISLQELIRQKREKSLTHKGIVVTFDDGYLDNYLVAKPLLEKYSLPATFFIVTHNLQTQQEFWWDELEKIILQTSPLPLYLRLDHLGETIDFDLAGEAVLTNEIRLKHKGWKEFMPPLTQRSRLYLLLWNKLKRADGMARQEALDKLRAWARPEEDARDGHYAMSPRNVQEIAANNLFEIGAHTHTHPALPLQQPEVQRQEIITSTHVLQQLIGKEVSFFSYPYGDCDGVTKEAVKEAGLKAAVTTSHTVILNSSDPYQLGRFQVNDWPGYEFEYRLHKWFRGF